MASENWSYAESDEWGDKCLQENQSPVNIITELVEPCADLCDLNVMYKPSSCVVEFNKNQNIRIKYDAHSGVTFKKQFYQLEEITVHTPSLHQLDGNNYDMEVCLIHSTSSNPYSDEGLIISCLYKSGPYFGGAETFFNQIINDIDVDHEKEIRVSPNWSASMLLPKEKSFYLYKGSLPFPPCSKNFNYIVMDTVGTIGAVNLEMFQNNLGKNIRPIRILDGRQIYYNSGQNINSSNIREELKSNNKYLRCVKKPSITNTFTSKETVKLSATQPPNPTGLSSSTKGTIKMISTISLFVMIFINAVYLIKYLFKRELAQQFIVTIVGTELLGAPNIIEVWRNSSVCMNKSQKQDNPGRLDTLLKRFSPTGS